MEIFFREAFAWRIRCFRRSVTDMSSWVIFAVYTAKISTGTENGVPIPKLHGSERSQRSQLVMKDHAHQ
jgi:hypothetical protein